MYVEKRLAYVDCLKNKHHGISTKYNHILRIFTYLYDSFHYISPCFIHSCKSSAFLGHLRQDVWRTENGLQIQPRGLDLEPFIQDLLKQQELALPRSEKQNTAALINSTPNTVSDD